MNKLFRDSIRQTKTLNIFDDAVGFSCAGRIELASYRVSGLVHWTVKKLSFTRDSDQITFCIHVCTIFSKMNNALEE